METPAAAAMTRSILQQKKRRDSETRTSQVAGKDPGCPKVECLKLEFPSCSPMAAIFGSNCLRFPPSSSHHYPSPVCLRGEVPNPGSCRRKTIVQMSRVVRRGFLPRRSVLHLFKHPLSAQCVGGDALGPFFSSIFGYSAQKQVRWLRNTQCPCRVMTIG